MNFIRRVLREVKIEDDTNLKDTNPELS